MRKETLLRALTAVRKKIVTADAMATGWLDERDRRRRQEAAFLRGIVRIEGSQRKAALIAGISRQTVSRILTPMGHEKHRADERARRNSGPTFGKVGPPSEPEEPMPNNVMRLRRPDWKAREPRRTEVSKWFEQYLTWTPTAQATARMLIFNAGKGRLPDAAYYDRPADTSSGNSALGSKKGSATGVA